MKTDSVFQPFAEDIPLRPDVVMIAMTNGTGCGQRSFLKHLSECVSAVMSPSSAGEQGIPYDDMTIELSRRIKTTSSGTAPSGAKISRTTGIDAKICLGAKLSQEQRQGILEAADNCHITKSIEQEMQIVCSLSDAKVEDV